MQTRINKKIFNFSKLSQTTLLNDNSCSAHCIPQSNSDSFAVLTSSCLLSEKLILPQMKALLR